MSYGSHGSYGGFTADYTTCMMSSGSSGGVYCELHDVHDERGIAHDLGETALQTTFYVVSAWHEFKLVSFL